MERNDLYKQVVADTVLARMQLIILAATELDVELGDEKKTLRRGNYNVI